MDKFPHKSSVNMPVLVSILADIVSWTYSVSVLDPCIVLKGQHFINVNQITKTMKSKSI